MYNAAQRRHVAVDAGKPFGEFRQHRNISLQRKDLSAVLPKRYQPARCFVIRWTPAQQCKVSGPGADEPLGDFAPQCSEPSSNQIARVALGAELASGSSS